MKTHIKLKDLLVERLNPVTGLKMDAVNYEYATLVIGIFRKLAVKTLSNVNGATIDKSSSPNGSISWTANGYVIYIAPFWQGAGGLHVEIFDPNQQEDVKNSKKFSVPMDPTTKHENPTDNAKVDATKAIGLAQKLLKNPNAPWNSNK